MEAQASGILHIGWIPGEFNLVDLFTNTTMPGNTRHNLVDSIFSNTASPIGDIEKSQVHFHTNTSKYLSHYKSIFRKWVLGIYLFYFIQIIYHWFSICGYQINSIVNIQTVRRTYKKISEKGMREQERTGGREIYENHTFK